MRSFTFAVLSSLAISSFAVPTGVYQRDGGITDPQILNFALTLEHLENNFYQLVTKTFSAQDFKNSGFDDFVRKRYLQVASHEKTHVEFLQKALAAAGAGAVQPCNYSFPIKTARDAVMLSSAFETIGSSAYTGASGLINDKTLVPVAASILSTEVRHSAWVDSAVLKQSAWGTAFETPLGISQVLTLATSFITSCPSGNAALLPSLPAPSAPALTVAKQPLVAGSSGSASFVAASNATVDKPNAQAVFLSGLGKFSAPITDVKNTSTGGKSDVSVTFTVPKELASTGAVYLSILNGNQTVAGPALLMFQFDSSGNPV